MVWFAFLALIPLLGQSFAWPVGSWADTALGFDLTTDYVDGYYGPWSMDYLRGSRWMGLPGPRGPWSYDYQDWTNPMIAPADYMYNGAYPYPRSMDYSKEKYVRDYPYGETEVGVRDSVSVRSPRLGLSRPPFLQRPSFRPMDRYSYPYASDYDQPLLPPVFNRRMFAAGMGTPRASSLRTGGDFMYLRR